MDDDTAPWESPAQPLDQPRVRGLGVLARGRDDVDLDPAPRGYADHLVQPPAVDILDVGRGVGRDAFVQLRLVVQAGQHRHRLGQGHRHSVHLDCVQPRERREGVEELPARRAVCGGRWRSNGGGHGPTIAHGIDRLDEASRRVCVSEYLDL
ncbi:MAG: hypothetical protein F4Y14_15400 [Acidobacteria bacterium]|nr:hypothetical protein [Acidobacteriota bacterium]